MQVFANVHEFAAAAGTSLGTTEWLDIDQKRIDTFAEATGDHQWIHTDPAKAADGPFQSTIAHGLLTLSLLPVLNHELYRIEQLTMAVNYGFDKVRFISPVSVGARVRATTTIDSVADVAGGVQAKFVTTIEIEGAGKPACVAESIARFIA
ncbi:MaoC family dehydratase [Nocardia uniformis]|uniref:MaoC family dehydratase n=1 Tax=Nocardia uniformis TaxID=53432 RepID=A0A849BZ77_9NOCA|nr:MaoC family dehydratase [Nocardia uniformis]NNH70446.1 MaoC family dehydratase [Nocardia uniformis]